MQFLTSRANTPAPFRPAHVKTLTEADLEALDQIQGNTGPARALVPDNANVGATYAQQKVDISKLESQANNL